MLGRFCRSEDLVVGKEGEHIHFQDHLRDCPAFNNRLLRAAARHNNEIQSSRS